MQCHTRNDHLHKMYYIKLILVSNLLNKRVCVPNPCLNSGTCTEDTTQPLCTCTTGFFGVLCQYANDDTNKALAQTQTGI
jgi:hypothetical protein